MNLLQRYRIKKGGISLGEYEDPEPHRIGLHAVYLFEIFSDQIDKHLLTSMNKTFDINGAEYGIDV